MPTLGTGLSIGQTRAAGGGVILKPKAILHDPLNALGLKSPYSQAAANAVTKYGGHWQWLAYDNLYDAGGGVNITAAMLKQFWSVVAKAAPGKILSIQQHYKDPLSPGPVSAARLFQVLDGMRSIAGPGINVFVLSGTQQPLNGDPVPTPGAVIGAFLTSRLTLGPLNVATLWAQKLVARGILGESNWQLFQPIVAAVAIAAVGEFASGTGAFSSGSTAGAGASSGTIAPTTVSTAVPSAATAAPVSLSTASIPTAAIPALSSASVAAPIATAATAGGSLLSTVSGAAGTIGQAAGALTAVGGVVAAVKASNATPGSATPGLPGTTGAPGATPAASLLKKLLIPGLAVVAWLAFS